MRELHLLVFVRQILKNINLSVGGGKIIGLLGRNGQGKTTLIKLINDLLTPTSGQVLINGKAPGIESKKSIAYLPERTYLDKSMTVKQTIKYFAEFYDNFDENKAVRLLKDLDLDINQKLTKMSKGMLEKVQLILVMSRNAELYILDEPLGGVDPAKRDYILDTIFSDCNEGASVIISTHLIADIERILDEVIFLEKRYKCRLIYYKKFLTRWFIHRVFLLLYSININIDRKYTAMILLISFN